MGAVGRGVLNVHPDLAQQGDQGAVLVVVALASLEPSELAFAGILALRVIHGPRQTDDALGLVGVVGGGAEEEVDRPSLDDEADRKAGQDDREQLALSPLDGPVDVTAGLEEAPHSPFTAPTTASTKSPALRSTAATAMKIPVRSRPTLRSERSP